MVSFFQGQALAADPTAAAPPAAASAGEIVAGTGKHANFVVPGTAGDGGLARLAQLSWQNQVGQINQAVVRVAGLASSGGNGHSEVVAGQSTYHRPECRLVQGKSGLERVTPETAVMNGLSPCRLCNPAVPDTVSAG